MKRNSVFAESQGVPWSLEQQCFKEQATNYSCSLVVTCILYIYLICIHIHFIFSLYLLYYWSLVFYHNLSFFMPMFIISYVFLSFASILFRDLAKLWIFYKNLLNIDYNNINYNFLQNWEFTVGCFINISFRYFTMQF